MIVKIFDGEYAELPVADRAEAVRVVEARLGAVAGLGERVEWFRNAEQAPDELPASCAVLDTDGDPTDFEARIVEESNAE